MGDIDLVGSLATQHGRMVVLCTHFLGEAGTVYASSTS